MVNTRSQNNREIQNEQPVVDGFVDDEDDNTDADHYAGSFLLGPELLLLVAGLSEF